MKRTVLCGVALLVCAGSVWSEETRGRVEEIGWGKFRLAEANDIRRLYNESKKITTYEPSHWRPVGGDEVEVIYSEVVSRRKKILRPDKVKLLKAGPNTVLIESPVTGKIEETGKTGYKVKVDGVDPVVKFLRHRGTQTAPTGWQPAPGEKARIVFRAEPAAVTFGVNYVADRVEKVAD